MGKDQDFVRFMCKHLVALGFRYETRHEDKGLTERFGAAPGFIMTFHGEWFWITAGHWFTDLFNKLYGNPKCENLTFFWIDSFGPEATDNNPIPYGYDPEDTAYFEVPEHGIDFGMIPIDGMTQSLLEANHIAPITETNWLYQTGLDFNHFRILGFPQGTVHDDGRMRPTLVGVIQISPEEARTELTTSQGNPLSDGWFAGRIPESVGAIDVKGMSGGPIYGFRIGQNGDLLYHVVAVQSRWYPKERIILGCPVPDFASRIHQILAPFFAAEAETAATETSD